MSKGEFDLIRAWTSGRQAPSLLRSNGVVAGIGDDAAVTEWTPGMQMVVTCDTMVEEIHFKTITMRDSDVGFKAMAAAVSDIAAMGAIPKYALISISQPKNAKEQRLQGIYDGLYECADLWNVAVIGGDTTSSLSGISITVTVIGEVENGKALLRSAAQTGDIVFVTGYPGCSSAGLDLLLQKNTPAEQWGGFQPLQIPLVQAHTRPVPQITAGRLLQQLGSCHALNDVSDGIASEAWEIAEASGRGVDLIEDRIPIAAELQAHAYSVRKDPLDFVLYGGEDYLLIGTMPADRALDAQLKFSEAGLSLHVIGYITGDHNGVRMAKSDGLLEAVPKRGYNHFGKE
ncbi:thiamine-phosphate kinase [Paenibacillus thalictri]|uniref:Thiamine-monophosphate kinase n=2 Tax=Paenibacillus thalictri TaxID=2527873 RepID=A0A4Q9DQN4_9BACL|nr:thiamine-phosphate kinase [Paenibacillus thalictri]